jgi:hypothetical protein
MGQKEGVSKLAPTAVATARDLLNYGWEMAGLQMGARYHFVSDYWGVPERAKPILDTVTSNVQGLYPFFKNSADANLYNYQECLLRLQHVSSIYNFSGWSPNPFQTPWTTTNSASIFVKRCWLRPELFDWQARSLWDDNRFDLIEKVVDSAQQEEGPPGAVAVLRYVNSIRQDLRASLPKAQEWMSASVEQLPQPTRTGVYATWNTKFSGKSLLQIAEELEKLYWQNPDSKMEDWVFLYYAKAGAFNAARRFYKESHGNLLDPVYTSNGLGHYAFILGYLLNDASLRQMALEDSASASYDDMILHMWDAAIQDSRAELANQVDELIERYEKDKGPKAFGAQLKEFLPLLPALANAKDPKHSEAISYFGKDTICVTLRWIWIEKFKLSKEDAIAFLGGRETDAPRHVLICYLDGDAEKTLQACNELMHRNDANAEQSILAKYLCDKLAKTKELDVPELKPADASSARTAVLARLAEK